MAVEPHRDGCPHLHMVIWTDNSSQLIDGLDKYFGNPFSTTKNPSVIVDSIDDDGSNAIYYTLKTISLHNHECTEELIANRAKAWRSLWGIQAFSFFSTHSQYPTVTPWKELRKIETVKKKSLFHPLWIAAKNNNWANYALEFSVLKIKTVYEETKNQFGEMVKGKFYSLLASSREYTEEILGSRRWTIQCTPPYFFQAGVTLRTKKSSIGQELKPEKTAPPEITSRHKLKPKTLVLLITFLTIISLLPSALDYFLGKLLI